MNQREKLHLLDCYVKTIMQAAARGLILQALINWGQKHNHLVS